MYRASGDRYEDMIYNRCGRSGLKLPAVSLGLWHNFGDTGNFETMKELCFTAFDNGICHFDLANNYGPAPGSAEKNFGRILKEDLGAYRDELIISTKAGYDMWPGPYGNWGSRKYLLASLDQSLQRMGLEYVDIFYHHRMDPETPLEETMGALAQAVSSGKALYAGLSNYDGETMRRAAKILEEMGCPFIIDQNRYSIFDRTIEKNGLKQAAADTGRGIIAFSPLAQGLQSVIFCGQFIHAILFCSLLLRLLSFDFSLRIFLAQAGQYLDAPEPGTYSTPHTVQFLAGIAAHRFVGMICNSSTKPMNL
ncbi:aldo/keto reductase [Clostridium sp. Marseille-P3244]|uniref:aldo/keto reductase n=1 Tax=Clostridium sp. Marseille-P3244 TaxID=1871020 RepID=UPI003FA42B25